MRMFRFIGDPNDGGSGPDVIEYRGMSFAKGKVVDVNDVGLIERLSRHSHFEEAKAKPGRPRKVKDDGQDGN